VTGAAYLVPNLSSFNVISSIAHEQPVAGQLIWQNTFMPFSTLRWL